MTVLRLERGSGALIHAPLASPEDDAADLVLELPSPLTGAVEVAGLAGVMIEPSAQQDTVHITRGGKDLWADPRRREPSFRDRSEGRFEFLPMSAVDLAHARALLCASWVGGEAADGPALTFVAEYPFVVDIGRGRLDLRAHVPRFVPRPGGYVLDTTVGQITITHAGAPRAEIQLRKRAPLRDPSRTSSTETLHAEVEVWLETEGEEEYSDLPMTVCNADRNWLFEKPYAQIDQITGRHRCRPVVVHEKNKYVLLSRFAEGVAFDEHGICTVDGYLSSYGYNGSGLRQPMPPGMRLEYGRLFVDQGALAAAPVLEGNTILFIQAHLSNYTHWLIDSLLHLHLLLDHAPPGARLLLPGTLRNLTQAPRRVIDHYASLRVFGFDRLPMVEISEPYCRLEHVYRLEDGDVSNMPASAMRGLRARVAALRPVPARRDRRIYVARRLTRRIANPEVLAPFLERQGFVTRYMEDHTIDEQIDMFSEAEWVIGPHGAELGNLLFCQPGTKVLELSPDYDYKPFYAYMCNKLDLTHGVLPCPTTDASFTGDIILDMHKFTALFRMLKNRL